MPLVLNSSSISGLAAVGGLSSPQTGSVLQVVNATSSSSFSTSSGSFVDTGFSASITPTSASSKILILVSVFNMVQGGNMAAAITMYRGATALDSTGFAQTYAQTGSSTTTGAGSGVFLDSPSTTSSTAYKLYFRNQNNNGTVSLNSSNGLMSIVLMEIAA